MIKKINVILVLTSIICSLNIAFTKESSLVFILKDISIILTINALYIARKLFKWNISDGINLIYIIFIFMAHFLGVICNFYGKIFWFDKFTHFLSGIVAAFGAIFFLVKCKKNNNIMFSIIFIISFTLMTASLWEFFEYLSSILFNVDPQRVVLTGVSDTMDDMIVAFLGSILVSISYLYEYKSNVNMIIKKFVKEL